jgi:hypothetical protein
MASSATPVDVGSEVPKPEERKRSIWVWWLVYGLLLLFALALLAFVWLREPEVVYRTVPGPGPDPGQVERLDEERARADQLRKEMSGLRTEVAADDCPPGMIKDPDVLPSRHRPPARSPRIRAPQVRRRVARRTPGL